MDSGAGKIYSMHKTLCTVAERGVSGAERCMYVHGMACMCGIHLQSKHRLPRL